MKLECGEWDSEKTTQYWLVLDIDQVLALASGHVPTFIQAMAASALAYRDRDEANARYAQARAKRAKRKPRSPKVEAGQQPLLEESR